MFKSLFFYLNKGILRFLPDGIYYNLLFFINCVRLNKPYYFLRFEKPRTFNEHLLKSKKYYLFEKLVLLFHNILMPLIRNLYF